MLPAPLVGMPSSQVQPFPQGPPILVKGLRVEGSADEVLAIALAALVYNTRCSGEDDHGRSLEDLIVAVVETASTGYAAGAVWPTPPAWRGTDQ